jgi:ADP-ribosylglycohydrolase/fructose-1,6-bisphosphatase/inositol monophosphatase family enzyme
MRGSSSTSSRGQRPRAGLADLGPALARAEEAARAAGAILARELARPGGPRGHDGRCAADAEAEMQIRDALRSAFPGWDYFGEETGFLPAESGRAADAPHWLVDPNDGTAAFLTGHRGAAVSIALVHRGRPVLGVVFAHTPPIGAPDPGGDCFAWAEGSGALRRNGRPVQRTWPDALSRDRTVLVSADADRAAEANARLVAPARFRAVPSVAYRLALVAAGEADAAVSVAAAVDFDYAAGHALLRGVGGDLLDARGQPVRYAPRASERATSGGACFGGARRLAEALARRDWSSVRRERSDPSPLVAPRPDRIDPGPVARRDRAGGLLMGQLVGDALGAQVEFRSADQLAASFPDGLRTITDGGHWDTLGGQPTDDSELALALARVLAERGAWDRVAVAGAYAEWYRSRPFDIGRTVATALGKGARARNGSVPDAMEAAASTASEANGALMRISPLAVAGLAHAPEVVEAWAARDAKLTHPHPVCLAANRAFVAALRSCVIGERDLDRIWLAASEATRRSADGTERPVMDRLDRARTEPPEAMDGVRQGWVLLALHNAFHQLARAPTVEDGLVATVMRGGDTDTNAAIAGALLGAYHGLSTFPRAWVDRVLSCRPLASVGAGRPRPSAYWPVDALQLVEALLALPGASRGQSPSAR